MPLPAEGFVRLKQIIGDPRKGIPAVIPVSQATWFRGVASGKYPQGELHGERIRIWKVEEIRALVAR